MPDNALHVTYSGIIGFIIHITLVDLVFGLM